MSYYTATVLWRLRTDAEKTIRRATNESSCGRNGPGGFQVRHLNTEIKFDWYTTRLVCMCVQIIKTIHTHTAWTDQFNVADCLHAEKTTVNQVCVCVRREKYINSIRVSEAEGYEERRIRGERNKWV